LRRPPLPWIGALNEVVLLTTSETSLVETNRIQIPGPASVRTFTYVYSLLGEVLAKAETIVRGLRTGFFWVS